MSNKTLVILIVVILVVFAGVVWAINWKNNSGPPLSFVGDNQTNTASVSPTPLSATATPAPSQVPTPSGTCARDFNDTKLKSNGNIDIKNRQVTINVKNFGNITVQLYNQDAPKAVENFLRLTDSGFYDCLTVHRVAKGFVIQAGDPNGNGTGGVSAFGKAFADELSPNTPSYKTGYVKGVLAMANSGPNTNGSQFFIMLADQPSMPHLYSIFGKVISGQDVVDKIGNVAITPVNGPTDGSPVTPVVMQSVKITK